MNKCFRSYLVVLIFVIGLSIMQTGCDGISFLSGGTDVGNPDVSTLYGDSTDVSYVKNMALYLSAEIYPPAEMIDRLYVDMEAIRALESDLQALNVPIPSADLEFSPPWVPGEIILGLDMQTARLVAQGDYHAWDALNASYGMSEMEVLSASSNIIILRFKDNLLHPGHLVELYQGLPGVEYAEPNILIGDGANIYPYLMNAGAQIGIPEKTIAYVFREAAGDCPSGCLQNRYWLFEVTLGSAEFVGYWDKWNGDADIFIYPDWWPTAQAAMDLYNSGGPALQYD